MLINRSAIRGFRSGPVRRRAMLLLASSALAVGGVLAAAPASASVNQADSVRITVVGESGIGTDSVRITGIGTDSVRITGIGTDSVRITGLDGPVHEGTKP